MSRGPCHIGQIRFELDVDAMAQGRAVMERISVFGRQHLSSLLAGLLEQHANSAQLLVLERVELDLGELAESQLEQLLGQGILRCLGDYLRRHAPPLLVQLETGPGPARGRAWLALCQFLAGAPLADPDQVLSELLRDWPRELARLLRTEGRRQAVRQRLAQRLGTRLLAAVIAVLEPGEAPLIASYVSEVCSLHHRQPLVAESGRSFAVMLWEFVLAYLLLERGSYFNTRSLAGHTIAQIARRYQVDYADLLARMTACLVLQPVPLLQHDGLRAILLDLASAQAAVKPPAAQVVPVHQRRLACIASYLEHGAWPEQLVHGAAGGIGELVAEVLEQDQDLLLALLRRLGAQLPVRQRLARQRLARRLPPAQRLALVHALEPVHGPWIGRTVQAIVEVQTRRQVVHDDLARFGQRLWEFVFAALLQERGSWFNTRSFVRSLLVQMSAHYNLRYQVLLQGLLGAGLARMPQARKHGLPTILLSLQQELAASTAPALAAQSTAAVTLDKTVRGALLRHILGRGLGTVGLRRLLAQALRERIRRGHDVAALGAQGEQIERILLQRDDLTIILQALGEELDSATGASPAPAQEAPPPNFNRAAREFVLRSFQVERGSYFNNRTYIKQLLHQLAARHGMRYERLLRALIHEAGGASVPVQSSLPAILLSLKAEAAVPVRVLARPAEAAPAADPCWRFVRDGQVHGQRGGEDAAALLRDGIERLDSAELATALRARAQAHAMLERLIRYLPDARLAALAEALAPGASGLAASWRLCVLGLGAVLPLSEAQQAGLAALTWRALLRVLLAQRGELSAAKFIAAASALLAPRLGLSLATLQGHLMSIAAARVAGQARYAVLLELLARSGASIAAPAARPARPSAPPMAPSAALLCGWLQYGMAGATAIEPGISAPSLWLAIDHTIASTPEAARALLLAAAGRQLERQRLACLLPPRLRTAVLRSLAGAAADELAWWHAALVQAADGAAGTGGWDARLFATLLAVCHRKRHGRPGLEDFVGTALDALSADRALPRRMIDLLLQRPDVGADARALLARVAQRAPARPAPARVTAAPPRIDVPAQLPRDERFPVANAGLVILWPFLDHYFRLLGMQDQGAFVDEAARHRAAALLHYLSHGTLTVDEPDLLLNKLLCGIEPGATVDCGGPLTEAEVAASGQLFAALSQAWQMVANTDSEGLRATFLRRAGTLERGAQQWTLGVPCAPFDVLMSSLPWALGTIRLSWMQTLLLVNWR